MREGEARLPIFNKDSEKLTPKDLQVLEMVAANYTNREIAEHLNLSAKYLKSRLLPIFLKNLKLPTKKRLKKNTCGFTRTSCPKFCRVL